MRYRALDVNNDYTFGGGQTKFLVDTPEAVAQAVRTRLLLVQGEWFLDKTEGVPYATQILGAGTQATRDVAIQNAILKTEGVKAITSYSSSVDPNTRKFSVSATLDTIYGSTQITQVL
jgi:hypothetical protein